MSVFITFYLILTSSRFIFKFKIDQNAACFYDKQVPDDKLDASKETFIFYV